MNKEELMSMAKTVIEDILYITIATVDKDWKPWNTPVYSAYDEGYNFYWVSDKENNHSKNISNNWKAFIVIYDSTVPEWTGFWVYMEWIWKEFIWNKNRLQKISNLLSERKNKTPRNTDEYLWEYPRRIYKFIPNKIYVNIEDERDWNYVDARVEITKEILNN